MGPHVPDGQPHPFPRRGTDGRDQVLGNTFFVRAVDLLGRPDPSPAFVFFGARDALFPEVEFLEAKGWRDGFPSAAQTDTVDLNPAESCASVSGAPPDTLPAFATVRFRWRGVDRDSILGTQVGSVQSFSYKLTPLQSTFQGGSINDTMATFTNLPPGVYTLTVNTTDDGGLVASSCQYFQVNLDPQVRIKRVYDSCTGDSTVAFRISNLERDDDECDFALFTPWDPNDDSYPPAAFDPCLPDSTLAESDTLPVKGPFDPWFFTFDVSSYDPDGSVDRYEVSVRRCNPRTGACPATPWECAPIDANGRVVVGPFTSGDHRVVVAAVDDLGQRGAAGAGVIDFHIDYPPRVIERTNATFLAECDCIAAGFGETIHFCNNDTTYVVARDQSPSVSDTPCPLNVNYEDGTPAPVSINDFNSFPQPGDVLDLAFAPDAQGNNVAEICAVIWMRDPDGWGSVGYIRWSLDTPLALQPFEQVTSNSTPIPASAMTPACFKLDVFQDVPTETHTLYVEVRDWLEQDLPGANVAQRTTKYQVSFTVNDVTNRRYSLPREGGS